MERIFLRLTFFLSLGFTTLALPSVRQCQMYTDDSAIQARCSENKKHLATYMPPKEAIFFTSNATLKPPTPEIPHPYYPLCPFDTHRDQRFCKEVVIPNKNRVLMIRRLFGAFLDFTRHFNLKWWTAHGALIGWFYNEDLLPWDTDVDVRILYHDLVHAYSKFHEFLYKDRYRVEINPNSYYRGFQEDDVIDARFIDTTNGLYIDILAMVYDPVRKLLYCKSPRYYTVEDLFPLKNDTFMGFNNVWLPNNPISTMEKDYGHACMEMKKWARPRKVMDQTYDIEFYKWNEAKQIFVADDHPPSWRSVLRKKKKAQQQQQHYVNSEIREEKKEQ